MFSEKDNNAYHIPRDFIWHEVVIRVLFVSFLEFMYNLFYNMKKKKKKYKNKIKY